MKKIRTIALTGGPSSGKSTTIKELVKYLESCGNKVIVVNETATELINSNVHWRDSNVDIYDFQKAIFEMQLRKEELFKDLAKNINYDNVVILCDRGLIDGSAYIDEERFSKIYQSFGFKSKEELLARYDSVIYLETTAKHENLDYGFETNQARTASNQEAIMFDEKVRSKWIDHPNFKEIPCFEKFCDKVECVKNTIQKDK